MQTMIQDLRYGVRMLLKNPGLTLVIVLLLALGIGVNTGVFTVLNGLLMRARVDKDPNSFIHLAPQYAGHFEQQGLDGAMSLGAAGYVKKPFSPDTLRKRMEQLLGVSDDY